MTTQDEPDTGDAGQSRHPDTPLWNRLAEAYDALTAEDSEPEPAPEPDDGQDEPSERGSS